MITPCLPACEPVVCDVLDYTGQIKSVDSYGRKKRASDATALDLFGNPRSRTKRAASPEEMLVVQSLKIVDRYGKRDEKARQQLEKKTRRLDDLSVTSSEDTYSSSGETVADVSDSLLHSGDCLDKTSMITGATVFLLAQLIIVVMFGLIWRRTHRDNNKGLNMLESRADSLSYMYDAGFARRIQ
jgi:hypothetical protein